MKAPLITSAGLLLSGFSSNRTPVSIFISKTAEFGHSSCFRRPDCPQNRTPHTLNYLHDLSLEQKPSKQQIPESRRLHTSPSSSFPSPRFSSQGAKPPLRNSCSSMALAFPVIQKEWSFTNPVKCKSPHEVVANWVQFINSHLSYVRFFTSYQIFWC